VKSRDWVAERIARLSRNPVDQCCDAATFAGGLPSTIVTIPGRNVAAGTKSSANYNRVSSTYFEAMGIRLTRGRTFTDQEANSGLPVVVVNESTARNSGLTRMQSAGRLLSAIGIS